MKRTLEDYKKIFYNKFPNSEIEILDFSNKKNIQKSKCFIYVRNKYGICEIDKNNLLRGILPSIQSALNKEEYLVNQIKEKFPKNLEKYEILNYTNQTNILVKDKYGLCKMITNNLINGVNPSIKTAINKTEYFINKAKELYQNKYDYSKTIYEHCLKKIIVICNIHGEFKITPDAFFNNQGCTKCGNIRKSDYQYQNPMGWGKQVWYKKAKSSRYFDSFKVYILECWNENERFYKIGRTFRNLQKRFSCKKYMPYNYKILQLFEFKELTKENADKVFDLENELKTINKSNKYLPKIYFGGQKECYSKYLIENKLI